MTKPIINPFSKAQGLVLTGVLVFVMVSYLRPNESVAQTQPVQTMPSEEYKLQPFVAKLQRRTADEEQEEVKPSTNDERKSKSKSVFVEECDCTKRVFDFKEFPSDWEHSEMDSTCSTASYTRGPGQQVISFSYFHPSTVTGMHHDNQFQRKYFEGIKSNIERIMEVYSGWIMRLYFNIDAQHKEAREKLCLLACDENNNFDICEVDLGNQDSFLTKVDAYKEIPKGKIQERPMIWRFWPVMDKTVDLFLSRDLDSTPSFPRETSAVAEFLSSPTALFHVMRDHPDHGAAIMGGTWGAKVSRARGEFETRMKKVFIRLSSSRDTNAYDQTVMYTEFWKWAETVSMAHDSFFCQKYPGLSRPFPTQRESNINNFVGGSPYHQMPETPRTICPIACRPKEHQDWIRC